ncbi:ABC transporter permease [Paraburkholderia sp.]|uniref:ABC transporter permease n=1 Tax=Paraburkholderia sp. TaxID=1926495 RepID=UPI002392D2B6|nr:ABC transporter permease [Paraburkholderia sp.]MDE1180869.1 ABC transporter permease [Paraburkholderia sp.]
MSDTASAGGLAPPRTSGRGAAVAALRKLGQLLGIVLGIAVVNFFLLRLAPGDAVQVIAGESGSASPQYIAALRQQFGLDQPLWYQFVRYLEHLARFDLGYSFREGMSVSHLIWTRLPATLLLMGAAVLIAAVFGLVLGSLAGWKAGRIVDVLVSTLSLICFATPLFWVGLMLVVVFSVWLDWLPVGGMQTVSSGLTGFARAADVLRHLVLPAVTLSLFYLAAYIRLIRASVIEVRGQDFIRTAVARGVRPARLFRVHILRNALIPFVTMLGMQIGSIVGGAIVVETVFSWPGLGRLAFDALVRRDLNVLLGILLCSSILVVLINWTTDAINQWLDPRIAKH